MNLSANTSTIDKIKRLSLACATRAIICGLLWVNLRQSLGRPLVAELAEARRKRRLSPQAREKLIRAGKAYQFKPKLTSAEWLAKGCGIAGNARHHGIDRKTLYFWKEHQHFQEIVELKKEEWRQELLGKIEAAGKEPRYWPASAWLLGRSKVFDGEYAQPKGLPANTGNIQINVVIGSPPSEHGQTTVTIGEAPACDQTNEGQSQCRGEITEGYPQF